jgi:type III pantothenate kinase
MILLIDAGNSRLTIGRAKGRGVTKVFHISANERHSSVTGYRRMLSKQIGSEKIEGCIMASVVPAETSRIITAVKQCFKVDTIEVSHRIKTGLEFRIKRPSSLGADRIANAVAAMNLYRADTIVVDFGTATTCCLVTTDGMYMGGTIMPGPASLLNCLMSQTAQLPKVNLRPTERILGEGTKGNIANGIMLGHAGAVEKVIMQIKEESGLNPVVIATGGLAGIMAPLIRIDHLNRKLTLEGLRILYEMNA